MKYFVRVGSRNYELTIDGDTVRIDGRMMRARVEDSPGGPLQLLTIDGRVHRLLARRVERGVYDLSMDGHRFTVEALDERARVIRELSSSTRRAATPAHVSAPMPGLVVRIDVREGDHVRAGQGLVVMEAMKMENELRAAAAGTVKRVMVAAGSAVEKGALLIELEAGS